MGVKIKDLLTSENIITENKSNSDNYIVTTSGEVFLKEEFNINVTDLKNKKRKFCINCLDWSERKNHIAGALAKTILDFLIENT